MWRAEQEVSLLVCDVSVAHELLHMANLRRE